MESGKKTLKFSCLYHNSAMLESYRSDCHWVIMALYLVLQTTASQSSLEAVCMGKQLLHTQND